MNSGSKKVVRSVDENWALPHTVDVNSGFSSERTNLSPFTKDFRGEEHSKSVSLFLTPGPARVANLVL